MSASLHLLYFLWCSNNKCFFLRGWKSKVEILFILTSWMCLYFPLLSAFLCIACCQQQCFPQWTDAHKNNYIKFTAMSTEICYIYKFTRLINCQILSYYCEIFYELYCITHAFLSFLLISWHITSLACDYIFFFSYYHKSESYKRCFLPRKETQFVTN